MQLLDFWVIPISQCMMVLMMNTPENNLLTILQLSCQLRLKEKVKANYVLKALEFSFITPADSQMGPSLILATTEGNL